MYIYIYIYCIARCVFERGREQTEGEKNGSTFDRSAVTW